jgi:hypothetical protein
VTALSHLTDVDSLQLRPPGETSNPGISAADDFTTPMQAAVMG